MKTAHTLIGVINWPDTVLRSRPDIIICCTGIYRAFVFLGIQNNLLEKDLPARIGNRSTIARHLDRERSDAAPRVEQTAPKQQPHNTEERQDKRQQNHNIHQIGRRPNERFHNPLQARELGYRAERAEDSHDPYNRQVGDGRRQRKQAHYRHQDDGSIQHIPTTAAQIGRAAADESECRDLYRQFNHKYRNEVVFGHFDDAIPGGMFRARVVLVVDVTVVCARLQHRLKNYGGQNDGIDAVARRRIA